MAKEKRKFVIGTMMVLLLVVSCFAMTGIYAKYTSKNSGEGSARVAKWEFDVNDKNIAKEAFTFNLYDTLNDTDGSEETDVTSTDKVIAPGTQGSFDIKLQNKSEVTAQYAIAFTVTNTSSIPIEYSTDGKSWSSTLSNITASDSTKLAANQSSATTVTVYWRWAYENNADETDTTLGMDGTATLSVKAEVTATQVD